jgi:hypothetical protein
MVEMNYADSDLTGKQRNWHSQALDRWFKSNCCKFYVFDYSID